MKTTEFTLIFIVTFFSMFYFDIAEAQSVKKRRALVIGLDGTTGNQLHYRVWEQKKASAIQELMTAGRYTICEYDTDERCARTHRGPRADVRYFWKTGPGWASVITGVDSLRHGVRDNEDVSLKVFSDSTRDFPSFFKRAKDSGLKTAAGGVGAFLTSHKKKKSYYGIVDYECGHQKEGPNVAVDASSSCNLDVRKSFSSTDDDRDNRLTQWIINNVNDSSVDITMGVFDLIDSAGHSSGFDSNNCYLKAISTADAQIKRITSAIKGRAESHNEEWLVILTSDHGGHRFLFWGDHGRIKNEDEVFPFVVTLFGSDAKLNELKYPVTHMDVHPTVMQWFGFSSPHIDGQVQGLPVENPD